MTRIEIDLPSEEAALLFFDWLQSHGEQSFNYTVENAFMQEGSGPKALYLGVDSCFTHIVFEEDNDE